MLNCKKCDKAGTIVLRRKDNYCKECFIASVNHKFRACIGKNKILSRNENVLVCVSGGEGSTVLLDLIYRGISLNQHKKLRIIPIFFYLVGLQNHEDEISIAEAVIKQCTSYNMNVHIAHISEYSSNNEPNVLNINSIPQTDPVSIAQFDKFISSVSLTSKNDILGKIKRALYIKYAKELECYYIFTGETTSTLAVNLLSNLTLGRGSQVEFEVGFCDSRNKIQILRPMKDVSHEELQQYINIMELHPQFTGNMKNNSLQTVIKGFVTDLQDNFQSTISTVCKTADKLGVQSDKNKCMKCILCENNIGQKSSKLSALEATNYSRTVSIGGDIDQNSTQEENLSMFPHINKYLCYACSRNYMEMDQNSLPNHIKQLLYK